MTKAQPQKYVFRFLQSCYICTHLPVSSDRVLPKICPDGTGTLVECRETEPSVQETALICTDAAWKEAEEKPSCCNRVLSQSSGLKRGRIPRHMEGNGSEESEAAISTATLNGSVHSSPDPLNEAEPRHATQKSFAFHIHSTSSHDMS